jgi:hypothetical protein
MEVGGVEIAKEIEEERDGIECKSFIILYLPPLIENVGTTSTLSHYSCDKTNKSGVTQ